MVGTTAAFHYLNVELGIDLSIQWRQPLHSCEEDNFLKLPLSRCRLTYELSRARLLARRLQRFVSRPAHVGNESTFRAANHATSVSALRK